MQHTIVGEWREKVRGIEVPLGLEGLRVLGQRQTREGEAEVTVMETQTRAPVPAAGARASSGTMCAADASEISGWRHTQWCWWCTRGASAAGRATDPSPSPTPPAVCAADHRAVARAAGRGGHDPASGSCRPRASRRGPRLVHACLEQVGEQRLQMKGRPLEEAAPLPTPRYLGIDEFARRKG